ncbi:MAG: response regulator [Chitinophagaceae bacterium]|nr:response regulator [Chitinophagaceae bacterium]
MIDKLLIIDDDPLSIRICELVIKNSNFAKEIVALTNGKEGVDYFSSYFDRKKKGGGVETAPDMIFLDLNMPIMDGWEFLDNYIRKYSDRLPKTKIAILSSSINPSDFIKAQQYDVVIEFVHKPLVAKVMQELKEHEQVKEYFAPTN